MSKEFHDDPSFKAWGPFVDDTYFIAPITRTDIIIASTVFGLANVFALTAIYTGIDQTRSSKNPWHSVYIWMIWLELAASVVIGVECLLYILKIIRPSFYFYMSILLNWSIQVQLLLQIIINRIRIILPDREKGRWILIGVAVFVTLINISVFCIWIPARLEISQRWIHINDIWDRVEKVLYLLLDGSLNWYFIRVVKANLVENGLQKYNRLVRFNQRIIIFPLLMDVMIIAAMSIPNGFVYAQFHPLAYLIKLNIEMCMANLIKKIAMANIRRNADIAYLFKSAAGSILTYDVDIDARPQVHPKVGLTDMASPHYKKHIRSTSMKKNEIRKTEEYEVKSMKKDEIDTGSLEFGRDGIVSRHSREREWDRRQFRGKRSGDDGLDGSSSCYSMEVSTLPWVGGMPTSESSSDTRIGDEVGDEVVLVRPDAVFTPGRERLD